MENNKLFKIDIQLFAGTSFVEGNVLPATNELKIAWTTDLENWSTFANGDPYTWLNIGTGDNLFGLGDSSYGDNISISYRLDGTWIFSSPDLWDGYSGSTYHNRCGSLNNASCSTNKFVTIDTSGWTEIERTINTVSDQADNVGLTYEDMNPPTLHPIATKLKQKFEDIDTAIGEKVTSNTAITGATKTKITYDSKGLVTAGADLAKADIPVLDATNIGGIPFVETCPTANNTDGLKFVVTETECETKYTGYIYILLEESK